jgi:hypothetical protein
MNKASSCDVYIHAYKNGILDPLPRALFVVMNKAGTDHPSFTSLLKSGLSFKDSDPI